MMSSMETWFGKYFTIQKVRFTALLETNDSGTHTYKILDKKREGFNQTNGRSFCLSIDKAFKILVLLVSQRGSGYQTVNERYVIYENIQTLQEEYLIYPVLFEKQS